MRPLSILREQLLAQSHAAQRQAETVNPFPLSSCCSHGTGLASSPLVPTVVLPPEKSEGHEGQGQLFSVDDGEKAAGHEGPLRASKKHLNIDVSPFPCTPP